MKTSCPAHLAFLVRHIYERYGRFIQHILKTPSIIILEILVDFLSTLPNLDFYPKLSVTYLETMSQKTCISKWILTKSIQTKHIILSNTCVLQLEEKTEKCLDEQRILIGEREELIGIIEKGNDELKQLEAESIEFFKLYPNFEDDKTLV